MQGILTAIHRGHGKNALQYLRNFRQQWGPFDSVAPARCAEATALRVTGFWDARAYIYSMPSSFHFLSTRALVFSSIRISSGLGRVKPSLDHLRVASMPIFEP